MGAEVWLRALLTSVLDEAEWSVLFPVFLIPWHTASVIQWLGRGVGGLLGRYGLGVNKNLLPDRE